MFFCDASEKAIAAVVYLQGTLPDGRRNLGFVLGKAKVAPLHGHSIPDNPSVLSPSTILTQKFNNNSELPDFENFTSKDMIRSEWKRVQDLADRFWTRWKKEYMQTLQLRRKWHAVQPDLKLGDVVLLKDIDAPRNRWPLAVIVDVMPSGDSHVRKVQVKIFRNNKSSVLTRPICELVPLLKADSFIYTVYLMLFSHQAGSILTAFGTVLFSTRCVSSARSCFVLFIRA